MNIVIVKFEGNKKEYCFYVPDSLVKLVVPGARVLVETRFGRKPAFTTSNVIVGSAGRRIAEQFGAELPLKQVLAVSSTVFVRDIHLPNALRRSIPSGDKIEKRMREYVEYGDFKTDVRITADGTIVDGYTAYLACKAWDIEQINALIMAEGL